MANTWDIKVPIKQNLLKSLILGLNSRLAIGVVLSYLDYSSEVIETLQVLSHSTRAYIYNAGGLKGFLKSGPISILYKLAQSSEFEAVTKH